MQREWTGINDLGLGETGVVDIRRKGGRRGVDSRRVVKPEGMKILISESKLRARIAELGAEITRDYQGNPLVLVGILKGSFIVMADLIRKIDLPLTCDFLRVSSYESGTESSGAVRFEFDVTQPLKGKHVLLVEDIVDTGLTVNYLIENLKTRKPASLRVCALLHKPARTRVPVNIHYLGFKVPDEFVIGYGLDYAGQFRNLPYIAVLPPPKS